MSTISTHVLDTSRGCPAEGLTLRLERQNGDSWTELGGGTTNDDGRVRDLLHDGGGLALGVYRMTFETGAWFEANQVKGFYPVVRVVFEIQATDEHYHVPLLISPYGYSTYRGS